MQCSLLRLEGAKGFDRFAGKYPAAAEFIESVRMLAAEEKVESVQRCESSSEFLILLSKECCLTLLSLITC